MKWNRVVFAMVAILGAPAGSQALDEAVQLEVRVIDIECRVLPGATVTAALLGDHGEVVSEKSATVRTDGRAFIPIPAGGRFTVSALFPGFVPATVGPFVPGEQQVYKLGICLNIPPTQPLTVRSH